MKSKDVPFENILKIPDIIQQTAKVHPEKIAFRIRRKEGFFTMTYEQVLSEIKKIANFLKVSGFQKYDKAGVLGENRPEWGMCYLGIQWAGGITVPLDSRASITEWAHLLRHSESKFIFVSSRFYDEVFEAKDTLPDLKAIISMDKENPEPNLNFISKNFEDNEEPMNIKREDIAVILYTSGTTGISKGVMLTHKNILSNLCSCLKVFEFSDNDKFFSVLPLHHVFEATAGFLAPLTVGASITYARSLKSNELLEDLHNTHPTVFLVVPLLLEKLYQGLQKKLKSASRVKKGLFNVIRTLSKTLNPVTGEKASKILFKKLRAQFGLENLTYLISGGSALPGWLSKEYELMGFPILQGYGLSETSPVVSVNTPRKRRNESVGLPLPGVEIRIDAPLASGIGEIVVKGDNVMLGYYKNKEATEKVLKDGWFWTGDLGKIDKDGYLYITGRKKSVIVTKGGQNIYPEEIEEELLKSNFIKEVLVLAKLHPRTKTEQIHAIVYPDFENLDDYVKEKGIELNDKTIYEIIEREIEGINSYLTEFKKVRSFSIREEEFPKTTTQKIKRYLFESGGIEIQKK